MDPIIYLYPEEAFSSSDTNYVAIRNNSIEDVNNLDPVINYTTDEGGDWAILIENNGAGGSDFHWYVMDITVDVWD